MMKLSQLFQKEVQVTETQNSAECHTPTFIWLAFHHYRLSIWMRLRIALLVDLLNTSLEQRDFRLLPDSQVE